MEHVAILHECAQRCNASGSGPRAQCETRTPHARPLPFGLCLWEWLRLLRATLPTTVDAITANEYKLAHLLTLYFILAYGTANSNTS